MLKKVFGSVLMVFGLMAAIVMPRVATAASVTLVQTFNYPATGTSIAPHGLNNSNVVVGAVLFPGGVLSGFERKSNSSTVSLADPNDGSDTQAFGVNSAGTVVGLYQNSSSGAFNGFMLQNGVYSDYQAAPLCNNGLPCVAFPFGINDAGSVVGEWFPDGLAEQPFVIINKVFTSIPVPELVDGGSAQSISNNGSYVTGFFYDGRTPPRAHGFIYVVALAMENQLNDPNFQQTFISGINNQEAAVGRGVDSAGIWHGIAHIGTTWVTYDFPGATNTTLDRVNDLGFATGSYFDAAGVSHGLLVKLNQ